MWLAERWPACESERVTYCRSRVLRHRVRIREIGSLNEAFAGQNQVLDPPGRLAPGMRVALLGLVCSVSLALPILEQYAEFPMSRLQDDLGATCKTNADCPSDNTFCGPDGLCHPGTAQTIAVSCIPYVAFHVAWCMSHALACRRPWLRSLSVATAPDTAQPGARQWRSPTARSLHGANGAAINLPRRGHPPWLRHSNHAVPSPPAASPALRYASVCNSM